MLGYGSWITAFSRCMPIVPGGPRFRRVLPQPETSKPSARIAQPERKDRNWVALLMAGLWQMLPRPQEQFCWQNNTGRPWLWLPAAILVN